jgi:hypothetical protein
VAVELSEGCAAPVAELGQFGVELAKQLPRRDVVVAERHRPVSAEGRSRRRAPDRVPHDRAAASEEALATPIETPNGSHQVRMDVLCEHLALVAPTVQEVPPREGLGRDRVVRGRSGKQLVN